MRWIIRLVGLMAILLIALSASAQNLVWEQTNGPPGAEIYSLVATSDGTLCSSTSGGVHRSVDGGNNWIKMTFTEGSTLFAASDTTLYAAGDGKVFRSNDKGSTWAERGSLNIRLNSLTVMGTVLYAGAYLGGVYRSDNEGITWTNIGLANQNVVSFAIIGTTLYAGGNGGVFRYDGGSTWTAVNTGLNNTFVDSIGVSGTTLYASTWPGAAFSGVYRSDDGGNNWVNKGLAGLSIRSFATIGTTLFAGTSAGVFRSNDGGNTWTEVNTGLMSYDVRLFAVIGTTLYAGTGGGVYRSDNSGNSWILSNMGIYTDVRSFATSESDLTELDVQSEDGVIDIFDLVRVAKLVGHKANLESDVNKDGATDLMDVQLITDHFGKDTKQAWRHKVTSQIRDRMTEQLKKGLDRKQLEINRDQLKKDVQRAIQTKPFLQNDKEITMLLHQIDTQFNSALSFQLVQGLADSSGIQLAPVAREGQWEIQLVILKEFLPEEAYGKEIFLKIKTLDGKEYNSEKIQLNDPWAFRVIFKDLFLKKSEKYNIELYLEKNGSGVKLKTMEFEVAAISPTNLSVSSVKEAGSVAKEALLKIGADAVGSLQEGLKSRNPAVRAGSAEVLGGLKWKPAANSLMELAQKDVAPVRAASVEALGKIAEPSSLPILIAALADPDESVQSRAKKAPTQNKDSAVPLLVDVLKSRDTALNLREKAASLLLEWEIAEAAELIITNLISVSVGAEADKKEELFSKAVTAAKKWDKKQLVTSQMQLQGLRRQIYEQHGILLIDNTGSFTDMEMTRIQEGLTLFPEALLKRTSLNILSRRIASDKPKIAANTNLSIKTIRFFSKNAVNIGVLFHELAHLIFATLPVPMQKERTQWVKDSRANPENFVTQYAANEENDEDYPEMIAAWGVDSVALLNKVTELKNKGLSLVWKKFAFDIEPFVYRGSDGIERVYLYRTGEGLKDFWGTRLISSAVTASLLRREDVEGIVHRDLDGNISSIELRATI